MGLFEGKKGLILGVANDHSIAWAIAQQVMAGGGLCGFTHLPDRPDDERQRNRRRVAMLTDPVPNAKFLIPLDVSNDEQIKAVMDRTRRRVRQDRLLAPCDRLRLDGRPEARHDRNQPQRFLDGHGDQRLQPDRGFATPPRRIMNDHGAIATMTYFGGEKAVPGYNVMGICKAALDASVKYLAYDLGPRSIRVNALSAGPIRTLAGRGAGVEDMLGLYEKMAPLGATSRTKRWAAPAPSCCRTCPKA